MIVRICLCVCVCDYTNFCMTAKVLWSLLYIFYIILPIFPLFSHIFIVSSSSSCVLRVYIECNCQFYSHFTHNNWFAVFFLVGFIPNLSIISRIQNIDRFKMGPVINWNKTWHIWHFSQHFQTINQWKCPPV